LNAESENARILRRGYEAFNSGDFEAVTELMHADIEWTRSGQAPDPEPLRGVEAIRSWMQPDIFEDQHAEIVEIIENGERIFVDLLFRVRAGGSSVEIENRGFHVWTIRDGRATRMEFHDERSDALKAAGLASG
jgi:ketosteroid isomerase-like protein